MLQRNFYNPQKLSRSAARLSLFLKVFQFRKRDTCKMVHGSVQVAEAASEMDGDQKKFSNYSYPAMTKTQGSFKLSVEAGEFTDSEILVMLGENGTGGLQRFRCFAPHTCNRLAAFEFLQQTAKGC